MTTKSTMMKKLSTKKRKTTLITTSVWRNTNNASARGICILIDIKNEHALSEITKWNNRILIVNCNGNPKTTIIVHY